MQSLDGDSNECKLEERHNAKSATVPANFIKVKEATGNAKACVIEDKDTEASGESRPLPHKLPIIEVSELESQYELLERADNSDSPHREFHTAVIRALNIKPILLQGPSGICQEASSLMITLSRIWCRGNLLVTSWA